MLRLSLGLLLLLAHTATAQDRYLTPWSAAANEARHHADAARYSRYVTHDELQDVLTRLPNPSSTLPIQTPAQTVDPIVEGESLRARVRAYALGAVREVAPTALENYKVNEDDGHSLERAKTAIVDAVKAEAKEAIGTNANYASIISGIAGAALMGLGFGGRHVFLAKKAVEIAARRRKRRGDEDNEEET